MNVRLAILDGDNNYLGRLTGALSLQYGDTLQIHGFTDPDAAINALAEERIQVFLADEGFSIDTEKLPDNCGFAYLVSGTGVDALNGRRAICKFQRADTLYRAIVDIFSESAGNHISLHSEGGGQSGLVIFASPCGGVGTTSMAAGYAVHMAAEGKRVFYLNLEQFNSADALFSGEGQLGMDDVIYAMKSKKSNLALKLEGCARRDASGVYFFSAPKVALDLMELTGAERVELIQILRDSGNYDIVVVDMGFALDAETLKVFYQADAMVWVGDGSESANQKTVRAYHALQVLEQREDRSLANRLRILYNKFSNKTGQLITQLDGKKLGGVPRLEHATPAQVRAHLARQRFLDQILE